MGLLKSGASAIGKLFIVVALAGAFLVGVFGVVYLSLQGKEVKVPEIVGKDYNQGEKDLADLGLKIKKRALRYSEEKPNTVLEQSPKAGDPVKTGQVIFVVVSQANPEGNEAPATVNKNADDIPVNDDDLDNAPKKTNKNANVKKPSQSLRDVSSNKPNKNTNGNVSGGDNTSTSKPNSNGGSTSPTEKPGTANKSTTTPTNSPKPAATKTPTSGDIRNRKVNP